jgi:hypothetical protein
MELQLHPPYAFMAWCSVKKAQGQYRKNCKYNFKMDLRYMVLDDKEAFLTSALHGGEWSASRPGHFAPWQTAPHTHWIGGLVGPRASLDGVVKRKIPSSFQK